MRHKLLYYLTVYLPLRVRDLYISFLSIFMRRDRVIEVSSGLFREKSMRGVLPDGTRLSYPLDEFGMLTIISEIYYEKIYDVRQVESFENICDIGAHIGLFTLRVSKLAPRSKIISVEPNPTNYRLLARNILINGLGERVQAFNVAAGERKEKGLLLLSKLSRGYSSMKRLHGIRANGRLVVSVTPLDDILSDQVVYDLMKMDIEGAETEALRGLRKRYMKVNRLIMEVHLSVVREAEVHEWLGRHGFVIRRVQRLSESCILLEAQRKQS